MRRATVPCFIRRIKTVVVAVAVEMRKSRARSGREGVALCTFSHRFEDRVEDLTVRGTEVSGTRKISSSPPSIAQEEHSLLRGISTRRVLATPRERSHREMETHPTETGSQRRMGMESG